MTLFTFKTEENKFIFRSSVIFQCKINPLITRFLSCLKRVSIGHNTYVLFSLLFGLLFYMLAIDFDLVCICTNSFQQRRRFSKNLIKGRRACFAFPNAHWSKLKLWGTIFKRVVYLKWVTTERTFKLCFFNINEILNTPFQLKSFQM